MSAWDVYSLGAPAVFVALCWIYAVWLRRH